MSNSTAAHRKLVLKISVSLDGFVCGPNGKVDWVFTTIGGADSADWILNTLRGAGTHIMGSRSYKDMAAFWPFSDLPIAAPMNEIPKVIFSRTGIEDGTKGDRTGRPGVTPSAAVLQSWAAPTVATGNLREEILRLKQQPGNYILAHGGARFAQSLAASGLIDEYRLVIHPAILGRGQALFAEVPRPADLRLISATSFNSGIVAAVYQPA